MKVDHISDMVKGWFVGGFTPSVVHTSDVEVAVKIYKAGDKEATHFHKLATEVTVIVSGRVRMSGKDFGPGDIVTLHPLEPTDFEAVTDAVNVVVKLPGAANDKYLGTPDRLQHP
jgi:hypothetical protein